MWNSKIIIIFLWDVKWKKKVTLLHGTDFNRQIKCMQHAAYGMFFWNWTTESGDAICRMEMAQGSADEMKTNLIKKAMKEPTFWES